MNRRPRRSAPLLVGGLMAAVVVGPLAVLAGLATAASTMVASYYGILEGPGGGALLLLAVGSVLTLAGWIAASVGLYRLATTVDTLGSIAASGAPR